MHCVEPLPAYARVRRVSLRLVDIVMSRLFSHSRLGSWSCVYLAMLCCVASVHATSQDLLDVPAAGNSQASHAVLMDVTRAGDRLVAVGERGLVLTSTDDGHAWQQAKVPTSVALTRVRFTDANNGWAVGHSGVVLHSVDSGATWTRQLDGLTAAQDEAHRAALTTDEHRQRNAQRLVSEGADKPWLDLLFTDALHGWVVGAYGLLFSTDDGGVSWNSRMGDIDNPGGLHLYAIRKSRDEVYIAGEQGALFKAGVDGRFHRMQSPYQGSFFGLALSDNSDVVAYGLRGNVWWLSAAEGRWKQIGLGNEVTLTTELRLADGRLLLADEAGRLSISRGRSVSLQPLPINALGYVSGLTQAADGAVVTAGVRGLQRIEASEVRP